MIRKKKMRKNYHYQIRSRPLVRKNMKKIAVLTMACLIMLNMTACGKKEIFKDPNDEFRLKAVDGSELEVDAYYVKQGAEFYKTYTPDGTASGTVTSPKSDRIFWMNKDLSLVPVLYGNELIAYQSNKTKLTDIKLERFRDAGWSVGLYGGKIDDDGYLSFSKKNVAKGSSAYEAFKEVASESIRIVSINDEPVSKDSLDDSGVIANLDQRAKYVVGVYIGTKYETVTLTADYNYFESYEVMSLERAKDTKNGYLAVYMTDNLPNGWYCINGSGFFKYYNFPKGQDEAEIDMNEAFYETSMMEIAAYAQQYSITVNEKTENVKFKITYSTDVYTDDEVIANLTAPDGTLYGMTAEDGECYVDIAEVMAGKWNMAIMPQDLEITDVSAEATTPVIDTMHEEQDIVIDEDDANIQFYAAYEGDGDVWGIVENQNGETRFLDFDEKNHILTTTYSYLPAGTYKVTIYHYADTKISDIGYGIDGDGLEEEIITVTE